MIIQKKTIIISAILVAVVLAASFFIIFKENSRYQDLRLISQSQALAVAMESYYDRFNAYPVIADTSLNKINLLTDSGFNESGRLVYYQSREKLSGTAILVSSPSNYAIKFELKNSWPIWGVRSFGGGNCRLTNNITITCQK